MPQYVRYPSGHYAAPERSAAIEMLFGFEGGGQLVRNEDPLNTEAEEHERRMERHWLRLYSLPIKGKDKHEQQRSVRG